ncbi:MULTISPECIES: DnaB-like helicase C-terminal domain-containing protein [Xenorhabdus]|uniref:DnaB-like helicase C-terminal domain-containing protein n=1 Tax=Xenorhabdus TaxID=626 RepID=UPI00069BFDE2|nr:MULTISPECIES: DnaB-like helicase C-terminal domain-containing protein [Xenorhabdus]
MHTGIARITESGVNAVQDIAGDIENQISNINSVNDGGTAHIMVGVEESIEILESMINGEIWKHKTELGMPDIDKAFGGFNNTDFIVVGGRPGMGKTMISTAITKSVALKNKKPVMFSVWKCQKTRSPRGLHFIMHVSEKRIYWGKTVQRK